MNCGRDAVGQWSVGAARAIGGDCGPDGKYYQKKHITYTRRDA